MNRDKQLTTYRVSYYKRNPIDPQSRWTIYRQNVTAETADEAKAIIQDCDCEVIAVENDTEFQESVIQAEIEQEAHKWLNGYELPQCPPVEWLEEVYLDHLEWKSEQDTRRQPA